MRLFSLSASITRLHDAISWVELERWILLAAIAISHCLSQWMCQGSFGYRFSALLRVIVNLELTSAKVQTFGMSGRLGEYRGVDALTHC
jgi:hypothetical protein